MGDARQENQQSISMVKVLYRLLTKKNILPVEADDTYTDSEQSIVSEMSRKEGELPKGKQGEPSPRLQFQAEENTGSNGHGRRRLSGDILIRKSLKMFQQRY